MSFSPEAKNELCKVKIEKDCCVHALMYGLLLFSGSFSKRRISLRSRNGEVIRLYAHYLSGETGTIVDIKQPKAQSQSYMINVPDADDRVKVLNKFGYSGDETNMRLNYANLESECCNRAFIRGAFLSAGSLKNPQKGYQLEFKVPYEKLAKDFLKFLSGIDEVYIRPGIINRKGSFFVYIKKCDQITDLLAFMGANSAAMEMIQAKMLKGIRSYVNRTTNFETANITKTASAAASQIRAIKIIKQKKGLDFLDEELRELAAIRLKNPHMSLNELGKRLSRPLSKSGINHRLRKIVDISKTI